MQKTIFTRLNEPFPARNSSFGQSAIRIFYVALFITLFLYFFEPFGLNQARENLFGLCVAFGAVTFAVSALFEAFCRYVVRITTDVPSWTLWKWILQSILTVCLIAIGNHLLLVWFYPEYHYNWHHFVGIVANTLTLGIIPTAFSGVLIQLQATKRNQKQAETISASAHKGVEARVAKFEIAKNEYLMIDVSQVLYVEAMQNYVVLHYLDKDQPKNQILRRTIGSIALQLSGGSVLQCHRSYLVNTDLVEEVTGNAQGLKLALPQTNGFEVPVSRTYIPTFKQAML